MYDNTTAKDGEQHAASVIQAAGTARLQSVGVKCSVQGDEVGKCWALPAVKSKDTNSVAVRGGGYPLCHPGVTELRKGWTKMKIIGQRAPYPPSGGFEHLRGRHQHGSAHVSSACICVARMRAIL